MGAGVTHGALDHAELAARGLRPEALLDFSSNLNPFGPPPSVRTALAALDPAPYPDRSCVKLRAALAAQHGCEPAQILAGNGSNELIHLIPCALLHPGDLACVVAPTFGEYGYASQLAGLRVIEWRALTENDFVVNGAALVRQIDQQRPRLTWLCAPNNPTGVDLTPEDIIALAEASATHNGLFVLDQTYQSFVRDREMWMDQLPSNVLLLHSLTKSYALAGLRIGYLMGDGNLLARIAAYQPTWSVSIAAQAAGLAALSDGAFLPTTMPLLWAASDTLHDSLMTLGFRVWRSALPFMLVRTGDGAATRAALLEHGCVVRDCASFGLPEWVRVAPRRSEENAVLLEAWKEIV
jgi:histidinol-phosphate aminotransferase